MKRLLRTLALFFARIIGAPGAYTAARKAKAKSASKTKPLRILLLRPDHLGDLVLTTPILQALREHAPDAHITMMVGPWSSEVVARHAALDRLLTCPFPGFQRAPQHPLAPYILLFRTAQQLRRGNYDLAINLRPDFWWGAALLYLAQIPQRVGYALEPGAPFLTYALPCPSPEHVTVSALRLTSAGLHLAGYAALVEPFTPKRYPLQFIPREEEQASIDRRLVEAGVERKDTIIIIHPGTGAPVKLWRAQAWTACANALTSETYQGQPQAFSETVRIILTGSKSERALLEEIARGMNSAPLMFIDMTVGQLAALLKRAYIVLGVDSGPLHLAVAQGTRTVQIFGPTDPRIFGPWGETTRHIVIASRQPCPTCPAIPCGRLDIPCEELEYHPCVRLVPEQEVLEAVLRMYEKEYAENYATGNTTTE